MSRSSANRIGADAARDRRRERDRRQLLAAPKFPPWQMCPECGENFACEVNGLRWCTSARCDPRGQTLRALDRWFEKHPAPAQEPADSKGGV
jgi:hypothetical protein